MNFKGMTTAVENIEALLQNMELSPALKQIANKVLNEERITFEEGVLLFEEGSLGYLGTLANYIRNKRHGDITYFNRNFHIEPTNICVFDCKFCSYSRLLKHKMEGWEFSKEQMLDIVKGYEGKPVTEVHIVGGVHPKMGLMYSHKLSLPPSISSSAIWHV